MTGVCSRAPGARFDCHFQCRHPRGPGHGDAAGPPTLEGCLPDRAAGGGSPGVLVLTPRSTPGSTSNCCISKLLLRRGGKRRFIFPASKPLMIDTTNTIATLPISVSPSCHLFAFSPISTSRRLSQMKGPGFGPGPLADCSVHPTAALPDWKLLPLEQGARDLSHR
jgi:hypothetical protein